MVRWAILLVAALKSSAASGNIVYVALTDETLTSKEAQEACALLPNGSLAEPRTASAQAAIHRTISVFPESDFWVNSLQDNDGTFRWNTDGAIVEDGFTNWYEGLPNGGFAGHSCMYLTGTHSHWKSKACDEQQRAVCQFTHEPACVSLALNERARCGDDDDAKQTSQRLCEEAGCCWDGSGDSPHRCYLRDAQGDRLQFSYYDISMTFSDAQAVCMAVGGRLLEERDRRYAKQRVRAFFRQENFWLGLQQVSVAGQAQLWKYATAPDSEAFSTNSRWDFGQPGDDGRVEEGCGGVWGGGLSTARWHDFECSSAQSFACEAVPTMSPSVSPSVSPSTSTPSFKPTVEPTSNPTFKPTVEPTQTPTSMPTSVPSLAPSVYPSLVPTASPTKAPSRTPSSTPTSKSVTQSPTATETLEEGQGTNPARATLKTFSFENGKLIKAATQVRLSLTNGVDVKCEVTPGLNVAPTPTPLAFGSSVRTVVISTTKMDSYRSDGSVAGQLSCTGFVATIHFPTKSPPAFSAIVSGFYLNTYATLESSRIFLNGQTNITIIPQGSWADYQMSTEVTVAGLRCKIVHVSPRALTCTTPRYDEACSSKSDDEDCGSRVLTVKSNTNAVECQECVFYARQCVDYSSTEDCSNAATKALLSGDNTPWSKLNCGYGEADDCRPCPEGGYCPGGYIFWPKPGWWVKSDDTAGVIPVRCLPPTTKRCVGFDLSGDTSQSLCGDRYSDWACSACASGFWPDSSSECQPCPDEEVLDYLGILYVALGVLAALTALFLLSFAATRYLEVPNGVRHSREFAIWAQSILQVVLMAASMRPPGLPLWLTETFQILTVVELNFGSFVHPACIENGLFSSQVARFSFIIFITLLAFSLSAFSVLARRRSSIPLISKIWSRCCFFDGAPTRHLGALRWVTFVAHTALYGITTTTAVRMVHCRPDVTRGGTWLSNYPYVECYGVEHRAVAILAWLTLILFSAFYPLWSALAAAEFVHWERDLLDKQKCVARNERILLQEWHSSEAQAHGHFLRNDYDQQHFFFLQLNMLLMLVSIVVHNILDGTSDGECIAEVLIQATLMFTFVGLLVRTGPYPIEERRWKLPTKIFSLVVTFVAYLLNSIAVMNWNNPSHERQEAVNVLSIALAVLVGLLCLVLILSYALYVRAAAAAEEGRRSIRLPGASESGIELMDTDIIMHDNPVRGLSLKTKSLEFQLNEVQTGVVQPATPSRLTPKMIADQRLSAQSFQSSITRQRADMIKRKKKEFISNISSSSG